MKNKLILNEEEDIIDQEAESSPADQDQISRENLISSLIKATWDHVELAKSIQATLKDQGEEIQEINDIISQEYIHIGQLEKVLQDSDRQAQLISDEREVEDIPAKEEESADMVK